MSSLYDIAIDIVGVVPTEFNFIYLVVTMIMVIGIIMVIFAPIALMFKLVGGK